MRVSGPRRALKGRGHHLSDPGARKRAYSGEVRVGATVATPVRTQASVLWRGPGGCDGRHARAHASERAGTLPEHASTSTISPEIGQDRFEVSSIRSRGA